jgi:CheY-like chemotaxis protein
MFWKKKKPKILIVEDDLNNHGLYKDAFESKGFDVVLCQTADGDFITEVDQFKPDLISMDLMIGKNGQAADRDGFEAMEELKRDARTKEIPIFVLSNFFQEKYIQRAKEIGAVDFINAQGQSLPSVSERYARYLDNPRRYQPSQDLFR